VGGFNIGKVSKQQKSNNNIKKSGTSKKLLKKS
jgi:hypothetical protein